MWNNVKICTFAETLKKETSYQKVQEHSEDSGSGALLPLSHCNNGIQHAVCQTGTGITGFTVAVGETRL